MSGLFCGLGDRAHQSHARAHLLGLPGGMREMSVNKQERGQEVGELENQVPTARRQPSGRGLNGS